MFRILLDSKPYHFCLVECHSRLISQSGSLLQESVCATFGAGLPYACVVDVGDQKTSVCCVDDGVSLISSR